MFGHVPCLALIGNTFAPKDTSATCTGPADLESIACESRAKRVDRQLFGRAGRQGDPGEVLAICSLEDEVMAQYLRGFHLLPTKWLSKADKLGLNRLILARAQAQAKRKAARSRRQVVRQDGSGGRCWGLRGSEEPLPASKTDE